MPLAQRSFGDYGQILRSPDLRLSDVKSQIVTGRPPFDHQVSQPGRAVFVYLRRGRLTLDIDGSDQQTLSLAEGTAIGFEAGRAHRWRAANALAAGIGPEDQVELLISSIPHRLGVLKKLEDGVIRVPHDAEPHATIIRHAVALHVCEFQRPPEMRDDSIIRRCAEIVLIEFIRFVRASMATEADLPAGLAHDEHLLRAWAAYFNDPRRRWTVQSLADAAGLSRTVFAERFRKTFGEPPLHMLTIFRLQQAEEMLRHTKAPLIEIASTIGYNSEAAFVRAFHRQFGMPPARFRAEQAALAPM